MEPTLEKMTFGAGCFWGMEKVFYKTPGVISTRVGYTGGVTEDPTYEQVCMGMTGHAEAIEVTYAPAKVSYEELLIAFWEWHDPTTLNRQGPDIGTQYRSVIFFHNSAQEEAAQRSKQILEKSGIFPEPIVTEILSAKPFYQAEGYHQKYLEKNPSSYCSHALQSPKIREILSAALA